MANGVNLANLATYVNQHSFEIMTQAVATPKIADYSTMKIGNKSGTIAINLGYNSLAASLASGGFNPTGSITTYAQVNLIIDDIQIKTIEDAYVYRSYYLSEYLDASAQLEAIPNEDAIKNLYEEQIRYLTEVIAFYGDGATVLFPITGASAGGNIVGLIANTTYGSTGSTSFGGSINLPTVNGTMVGPTSASIAGCWSSAANATANAINQMDYLCASIPAAVIAMDDLHAYCSIPNYLTYLNALRNNNYFHYDPGQAGAGAPVPEMKISHANSRVTIVPFAGMGNSCRVFVGPKKFLIYGLGLDKDIDLTKMEYDPWQDQVKYMAKWRCGFALAFPEMWVTNNQ